MSVTSQGKRDSYSYTMSVTFDTNQMRKERLGCVNDVLLDKKSGVSLMRAGTPYKVAMPNENDEIHASRSSSV